jgi:hypothetical protein
MRLRGIAAWVLNFFRASPFELFETFSTKPLLKC